MQSFTVSFSVGQRNASGSWDGTSSMSNMQTTVTAENQGVARVMVESMYGGYNNCQIHTVNPC